MPRQIGIPDAFRRGPDHRSDIIRKRKKRMPREAQTIRKKCPKCWRIGQRGWAKGFCNTHAKKEGLVDPRRSHDKAEEGEEEEAEEGEEEGIGGSQKKAKKKLKKAKKKLKKATRKLTRKLLKPT